jgi:hypothetical protein
LWIHKKKGKKRGAQLFILELGKMEKVARLREQVIAGFVHVPQTSITVMLRMSRGISEKRHHTIRECVKTLVADGLLRKTTRESRLPPLYELTKEGYSLANREEIGSVGHELKPYERNVLTNARNMEVELEKDQETVLAFLKLRGFCSSLMIRDLLRQSTSTDNNTWTNTVLSGLAWNNEIEEIFPESSVGVWRYITTKMENHVWD